MKRASIVSLAVLVGLLFVVGLGCQRQAGPKRYAVSGKVTYQGQPVGEGQITFEDKSTGIVDSAMLQPDGSYSLQLPEGNYIVTITPPLIQVGGADTEPDEEFKKVDNIPQKYWNSDTTPLKAQITPDQLKHDFDLQP